jgi:hypothetical protein
MAAVLAMFVSHAILTAGSSGEQENRNAVFIAATNACDATLDRADDSPPGFNRDMHVMRAL